MYVCINKVGKKLRFLWSQLKQNNTLQNCNNWSIWLQLYIYTTEFAYRIGSNPTTKSLKDYKLISFTHYYGRPKTKSSIVPSLGPPIFCLFDH